MSDKTCDRCLSDGEGDEDEPETICHGCQDEMVATFRESGEAGAVKGISEFVEAVLPGSLGRELARQIREGKWKK